MMVRRKDGWLSAKVGDELVMMSAEKGNYIGLSDVGARIWELLRASPPPGCQGVARGHGGVGAFEPIPIDSAFMSRL